VSYSTRLREHAKKIGRDTRIALVGAGQMGNGIAHVFAQQGYPVNLIDVKQEALDKALATIAKNLDRQIAKGSISEADKKTNVRQHQLVH